jgi:hypothetical protein
MSDRKKLPPPFSVSNGDDLGTLTACNLVLEETLPGWPKINSSAVFYTELFHGYFRKSF